MHKAISKQVWEKHDKGVTFGSWVGTVLSIKKSYLLVQTSGTKWQQQWCTKSRDCLQQPRPAPVPWSLIAFCLLSRQQLPISVGQWLRSYLLAAGLVLTRRQTPRIGARSPPSAERAQPRWTALHAHFQMCQSEIPYPKALFPWR